MARKKRESTDIDQYLYPRLEGLGIQREFVRRDTSTAQTSQMRGDIWISKSKHDSQDFEKDIYALIEAKDRAVTLGDKDWQDAITQGQKKAKLQGLSVFFVSNTDTLVRCYNTQTLDEVSIDGDILSSLVDESRITAINTQVNAKNSSVLIDTLADKTVSTKKFRTTLWNLRQIYRANGINKGEEDSMIKTSLAFCILKIISEQQAKNRTMPGTIDLWGDWRKNHLRRDINDSIDGFTLIKEYAHSKESFYIDNKLTNESIESVIEEFSHYDLFGSDFDFFGLIYETFAQGQIKKDFGEFYTPRQIIRTIVKILFAKETSPRPLKICDPACGTGGFLVESYLYLRRSFKNSPAYSKNSLDELKNNTFHGYDINDNVAIPFTRINMLMADDGGSNIKALNSLVELEKDEFDYVLANVPYGQMADKTFDVSTFRYSNKKRYEHLFLEKIVDSLKSGGRAAVIIPDGLIETTGDANFRQKFLMDVRIEAIVSLPNFVFEPYTQEKTYIIFFEKKRDKDRGKFQSTPIWHYIVDNDGFQSGAKRYPIRDSDLPALERDFPSVSQPGKCGLVDISEVNADNFYSLSSENYLRKPKIYEIDIEIFRNMIKEIGRGRL